MHSSTRLLCHNATPKTQAPKLIPHCSANPQIINFNPILRRDFASSSLILLTIGPQYPSRAETTPIISSEANAPSNSCVSVGSTDESEVFLDVSIDGEPIGRIIIGLYSDNVPIGSARFRDLISGAAGVTYRRKEFVKIMPNYIQNSGLRSYGVDLELAKNSGASNLPSVKLLDEFEKQNLNCGGLKNVANSVSIIVKDPFKPPPKIKLVARKGKLEIDEEEVGNSAPNGTEFVIVSRDSPELDNSALVIGRVVRGMEVVERIEQVKTVQENTTSPYFRVAKLIGDKRAVVAERGFNRPYSKVVITNCGIVR